MIFLYIILGLIVLYLIFCYIIFFVIFSKYNIKQIKTGLEIASKPFKNIIERASNFYDKQPKKDLFLKSHDNLILHASFIECKNAKATIVLLHGYKSTAKNDLGPAVEEYLKLKLNIILVDNRSVSLSGGNWTTFGLLESKDAVLWVNYAKKAYKLPVILGGISMGASTALFALPEVKDKISFVVEDCAYACPYDQICHTIDTFTILKGKLFAPCVSLYTKLFLKIDLKRSILNEYKDIKVPAIFIHGKEDTFVPFKNGKSLYDNYDGPKELLIGDKAGHGLTYYYKRDEYIKVLQKYIKTYIK